MPEQPTLAEQLASILRQKMMEKSQAYKMAITEASSLAEIDLCTKAVDQAIAVEFLGEVFKIMLNKAPGLFNHGDELCDLREFYDLGICG